MLWWRQGVVMVGDGGCGDGCWMGGGGGDGGVGG